MSSPLRSAAAARARGQAPDNGRQPGGDGSEAIIDFEIGDDPEAVPTKVAWMRVMRFCRGLSKGSTAVVKNREGKTLYTYKYRGIDDVVSLAGAALREIGVMIMPVEIVSEFGRDGQMMSCQVRVTYRITSLGDGEIVGVSQGAGLDMGDKALVKALQQALRIFLTTALSLPTYDVTLDSDASPVVRPAPPTPVELRDEMLNPKTSTDRLHTIREQLRANPSLLASMVPMPNGPDISLWDLNTREGKARAAVEAAARSATDEGGSQ